MNELNPTELEQVTGGWTTIQELMDELQIRDAFPIPPIPGSPYPIGG